MIAQGREDKARTNIGLLYGSWIDKEGFLASVKGDLETKGKMEREASFRECFRGTNRLRTLIAMSTFFIQGSCAIAWIIG